MTDIGQFAINCLVGVLGFCAIYLVRKVDGQGKALTDLQLHMAEQYVRQPEIQRLEESVTRVNNTLEELVKLVHEMKGQMNKTGG